MLSYLDLFAEVEKAGEVPVSSSPEGTIKFENRNMLGTAQYLL